MKRVVVTGIGMVTSLGNSVRETWGNLILGKSGIDYLTRFNLTSLGVGDDFPRIAGEVKHLDLTTLGIERREIRRMDRFSQFALAAAIEAVNMSRIHFAEEDCYRIGIQIGVGLGGAETWEEQCRILFDDGPGEVSAFFIPKLIANMAASHISMRFGIKGPNITNVTACASGAHAIGEALDKIRSGRADVMICGGAEAGLTLFAFSGFNQLRALSRNNANPQGACRPFDRERTGFVMAEGAAILILEERKRALRRGAEILGELVGYGATGDAFHITEPAIEGQRECMKIALKDARIKPKEIGYINAHGTATPSNDRNETAAIKGVFGKITEKIPVSSTKSMTGHALGAAGAIEACFTIKALRERTLPPTINLENPDPECDLDYIPNQARQADVEYALSNSFGFGGTNATLVFRWCE